MWPLGFSDFGVSGDKTFCGENSQVFLKVPQPLVPFPDDSGVTSDDSDEWNLKCSELHFQFCLTALMHGLCFLAQQACPSFLDCPQLFVSCTHMHATIQSLPGFGLGFIHLGILDLQNSSQYFLVCLELLSDSLFFAFPSQMPEKIDIGWNKKMLRTAGLCTTGEIRYPKRERYAKIEIALKVCDSAGDGRSMAASLAPASNTFSYWEVTVGCWCSLAACVTA